MAEKTWNEKRAEQDRARGVADAKRDAEVANSRGTVGKAVTRVAKPVTNALMRLAHPPAYSDTYEQTYAEATANKACGGKVKKMASGGSVCRGGGAAVRGTKFSGVK